MGVCVYSFWDAGLFKSVVIFGFQHLFATSVPWDLHGPVSYHLRGGICTEKLHQLHITHCVCIKPEGTLLGDGVPVKREEFDLHSCAEFFSPDVHVLAKYTCKIQCEYDIVCMFISLCTVLYLYSSETWVFSLFQV